MIKNADIVLNISGMLYKNMHIDKPYKFANIKTLDYDNII